MSQAQKVRRIGKLAPIAQVPEGAEIIGYVDAKRTIPIVRETVRKVSKVPVMETVLEGGKTVERQAYKKTPSGEPVTPRFRAVVKQEVVEYALVPMPDNSVRKNYDFKPDPEEAKRVERAAKVEHETRALAEALVDAGMTAAELVAAVKPKGKKAAD